MAGCVWLRMCSMCYVVQGGADMGKPLGSTWSERKIKPRQGFSRWCVKRGSREVKGRLDRKCISGWLH